MIIHMNVAGLGQCALDHLFMIDTYPAPDTKKEVLEWSVSGGGPVATALVSLARLGGTCRFYGIIGDDEAGQKISHSLKGEHIDITGLLTRPDSRSQVAFIAVERGSGSRTIFWKRPSAEFLKPHELPDDFPCDAEFLILDGLMPEVSLFAARKARSKGVPVMLDAGKVREGMIELAHLSDYVVSSEEFAKELTAGTGPFDPEKAVVHMRSFGAKAATITLGSKGSMTACGKDIFHVPAFRVNVIDTTGAGDVFHGGYVYGLLQKWEMRDVVRFATAFAALKCRQIGGRNGIPSLEEVNAFLRKNRA